MSDAQSKKILIVDDEPDVRSFLQGLLEDEGHVVRSASNGIEGLERVREERPDLILLDLQMPDATGTDLYRRLRDREQLRGIPVIVVSGLAGRNVAVSRNVPVLAKPIDERALLLQVRQALARPGA